MNGMRKVVFFLTAMMLAAFAMPAAADKVFQQTMSSNPSPLAVGASGLVSMQLNNISSDTGNSNIGSFKLNAPSGFTVTSVYGVGIGATQNSVAVGGGYTATVKNNGSSVWVSSIQVPLKPFGSALTLSNMQVNVTCTPDTTGTWVMAGAWNGQGFSGQSFTLNSPAYAQYHSQYPSVVTTPASGVCGSISFVNQPATTFAGYPITNTAYNNPTGAAVSVSLSINGSPAPDGTQVTLSLNAGSCSISNGSAPTSSGVATFSTLSSAAGTGCKLTASGGGVGPSAPSNTFDITGPLGTLSCAPNAGFVGTLDPDVIPPLGGFDWGLLRGLNTDGSCGDDIPFTFTLDTTNRAVTFTEDSLGQHPSVEYIIRWPTVSVDADGWSARQPCVSWGVTNPVFAADATYVCGGDYVPAIACVADNVDGGTAVMPDIPNVAPFAGNSHTQFQPTSITGNKAKVCVAQQGWTSSGGTVQYWTKLIDQSDTGIRLP